MYTDLYGLETISLRYFNVFGERSPTVGQYAPVIGIFQRQEANGDALTIIGDGSQRRDFVHVKDVARANYLASLSPIYHMLGHVFNVGSGKNYSIQEIANAISDAQIYLPERSGEASTTLANIDRIGEIIGWKPEIDVMEWIKTNG
jgi:UDP-glucose 4-epimerase